MAIDLIVSRYKENIDWISLINNNINVIIYNKFYDEKIKLQNVGREGHTYLTHIINNYDNLSDFTIFSQGDPFHHYSNFLKEIDNFYYNEDKSQKYYLKFLCPHAKEGIYANFDKAHKTGLPMYYFFDLLFNMKLKPQTILNVYYGAQFIVHKNNILSKPKQFYSFLLKFLSYDIDPIEGYIFERLWLYILDPQITISNKYLLFNSL